jgi:DNA-directed RNA polymerase subunit RPC12/RpoP
MKDICIRCGNSLMDDDSAIIEEGGVCTHCVTRVLAIARILCVDHNMLYVDIGNQINEGRKA